MSDPKRRAAPVLRVLMGALMLMAVVMADGRPVVFADTNIYYWMGEMQFRPLRYALSPLLGGPASAAQDPDAADEAPAEMQLRRTEMAARSPWFGMMLYAVTNWGSLWWLAGLQALAMAFAVHTLWRALFPKGRNGEWYALMSWLAVGSTLPFFAGFAMPDVWAGGGLIAVTCLVLLRDRIARGSRFGLYALLLASLAFHQSNAIVAMAVAVAIALVAVRAAALPLRSLAPGLCALVVAIGAALALNAGYIGAVRQATGETMRSPPFLAARVLADGPGRKYLKSSCAAGGQWALCRFSNLPLTDSQDILWSGDPGKGVFGRSTAAERIRIDDQQMHFVIMSVLSDPMGTMAAALGNFGKALTNLQLEDPLRDPHFYLTDTDWRDTYIADMVHKLGPCGADERGCKPRFTGSQSRTWHGMIFILSLLGLAWIAGQRDWRRKMASGDPQVAALSLVALSFIIALLANAAITGVLSGPFPRYQARITWLIPLMAALFVLHHQDSRKAFVGDGRPG